MIKKHFKPNQKKIAKARMDFLFQLAKEVFKENSSLADKYVKIARRIAMKHKLKLDPKFKKMFCRNCHKYIMPGINCRVRLHRHRLIYYCLSCRHYTRHPVK